MAKQSFKGLASLIAVVCLLVGGIVGYCLMPDKIVERYYNDTVQVPVEKIVEVNISVPLDIREAYLNKAVGDFMEYVDDNDYMKECGSETYDMNQIVTSKVGNGFTVAYLGKDKHEVTFNTRLKYLDKDTSEKCYNSYEVQVTYEEDEKPAVEIL